MKPRSPYELRLFDRTLAAFELETDEFGDLCARDLLPTPHRVVPQGFGGTWEQFNLFDHDARHADVLEKARARLGALPAVAAGSVGRAAAPGFSSRAVF